MEWILVKDKLPLFEEDDWVLGYSKEWINEDFNPRGIRICCIYGNGEQWCSANWFDYQDYFKTDLDTCPTHWMKIPNLP